jgi:hypothetical protein
LQCRILAFQPAIFAGLDAVALQEQQEGRKGENPHRRHELIVIRRLINLGLELCQPRRNAITLARNLGALITVEGGGRNRLRRDFFRRMGATNREDRRKKRE